MKHAYTHVPRGGVSLLPIIVTSLDAVDDVVTDVATIKSGAQVSFIGRVDIEFMKVMMMMSIIVQSGTAHDL
jgi:hypothetical protein